MIDCFFTSPPRTTDVRERVWHHIDGKRGDWKPNKPEKNVKHLKYSFKTKICRRLLLCEVGQIFFLCMLSVKQALYTVIYTHKKKSGRKNRVNPRSQHLIRVANYLHFTFMIAHHTVEVYVRWYTHTHTNILLMSNPTRKKSVKMKTFLLVLFLVCFSKSSLRSIHLEIMSA